MFAFHDFFLIFTYIFIFYTGNGTIAADLDIRADFLEDLTIHGNFFI